MPNEPAFSVHFIDCRQGNMTLLVTPTATVLYDCNVTEETADDILRHLRDYIPERFRPDGSRQWIDWFICSHRDADHLRGLDRVNDFFPIRGIVDPGTTSGSTEAPENQYYMALKRRIRKTYGDSAEIVPTPSVIPLFNFAGVLFYCLCSGKDDPPSEDGHYGNNVFQVEYAGRRVLLTGDSDWRAWRDRIMPAFEATGLLASTVLVASHHGSRSFFVDTDPYLDEDDAWKSAYEKHLSAISPTTVVISCGDQSTHNHPNPRARSRYKQAAKHNQLNLTRDTGTLIGQFSADGSWTVTPSRFLKRWTYNAVMPPGKSMDVTCRMKRQDAYVGEVQSGAMHFVGCSLEFSVTTTGGFDPKKATYRFEVSNGGTGQDADHDEIYFKSSDESGPAWAFRRDLSFQGTHLLRCEVIQGSLRAQRIFVIHGIR
jgi:beta-lactamase superfamily II metal-dependent hydrolase